MLFEEWVERVGRDQYVRACELAWRTPVGTGGPDTAPKWPEWLAVVPHDFADAWHVTDTSLGERLDMGLRLYRAMPCYANTMPLKSFYERFGPLEREQLWNAYRSALASEHGQLAEPIAYSLWVDFFEDQQTVNDAWSQTTRRDAEPWARRVGRVLGVAGPVPWGLKAVLFEQLIGDVAWHPRIYDALKGSAFDYYGQVDPSARDWLERLELAPAPPDHLVVRERLAGL